MLKHFKTGYLLTLSLAVPRGKGGGGRIDLVPLEVWGPKAERLAAEAKKGTRVWVAGRLIINRWSDKYGQAREEVRVRVREAKVLVGKERGLPSLHNVNYVGRVESDPMNNYLKEGRPPLEVTLAVDSGPRGGGGASEDGMVRLQFEAWGRTAEGMVAEARKGSWVWVYGKLATYSWVDNYGQSRCDVRVRMEKAGLLHFTVVGKEEKEEEEKEVDWWGGLLGRMPQKKEKPRGEVGCLDVEIASEQEQQQLEMVVEEMEEQQEEQQDCTSSKSIKARTFLNQLRRRFLWRRKGRGNGGGSSSWLK